MSKFKLEDSVEWTSQSSGITRTKTGVVVEVVPAGRRPTSMGRNLTGLQRKHESYVVLATVQGRENAALKKYWPLAAKLRLKEKVQ